MLFLLLICLQMFVLGFAVRGLLDAWWVRRARRRPVVNVIERLGDLCAGTNRPDRPVPTGGDRAQTARWLAQPGSERNRILANGITRRGGQS